MGMTNGEKFKEVFGISQVDEGELYAFAWLPNHDVAEIPIDWWSAEYKTKDLLSKFNKIIKTITPQERTGHWIHRENMDYLDKNKVIHNHFMCQDCGFIHDFIDGHTAQYKYCPNCGARMVEPQESEDT